MRSFLSRDDLLIINRRGESQKVKALLHRQIGVFGKHKGAWVLTNKHDAEVQPSFG